MNTPLNKLAKNWQNASALISILSLSLFFGLGAVADSTQLEAWIQSEARTAETRLVQNISPRDGLPGAVLASPSRHDPDYYYNWVRDAALVTEVFVTEFENSKMRPGADARHSAAENILWDYVEFNQTIQVAQSLTGLGEPKFYVDGRPFNGPWGRPQNDSPALRANVLMRFMKALQVRGRVSEAVDRVWPLVLNDLSYVSSEILSPSFDLWEEFKGDNFFTLTVDRAALLNGAQMAQSLNGLSKQRPSNNEKLATLWRIQAAKAEGALQKHVSQSRGQIIENLDYVTGSVARKESGLDVATVLAVIHTDTQPYLSYKDTILNQTLQKQAAQFQNLYAINNTKLTIAPAIGRYPEDVYYNGNPWFLTTLAFAEFYYRQGLAQASSDSLAQGDLYLERVRLHTDGQGHMSEHMDKGSGYMLSAADLSWSYAAFLTAIDARDKLKAAIVNDY